MADVDEDYEDAHSVEGVDEAAQKVKKFLHDLKKSPDIDGDVTIVLEQTGKGLKEKVFDLDWEAMRQPIEELVVDIVDRAVDDIMGMSVKTMRYVVTALDEDDNPLKGRAAFTLKSQMPESEDEDLEDIEDLPNRKGLLSQTMRHQEAILKTTMQKDRMAFDVIMQDNAQLRRRVTQLEDNLTKQINAYEELVSGRHARDLELKKLENAEKRKDQVASTFVKLAPMVGMKLMGAVAPPQMQPQGPSPLEGLLFQFVGTLEREHLDKIVNSGIFNVDQLMVLQQMIVHVEAAAQAQAAQGQGQSAEGQGQSGGSPEGAS